jgi:hypothetical protein
VLNYIDKKTLVDFRLIHGGKNCNEKTYGFHHNKYLCLLYENLSNCMLCDLIPHSHVLQCAEFRHIAPNAHTLFVTSSVDQSSNGMTYFMSYSLYIIDYHLVIFF